MYPEEDGEENLSVVDEECQEEEEVDE